MALVTAAKDLERQVRSTRRIRLRYLAGPFPEIEVFRPADLADWVRTRVASGELILLDELTLVIDGDWRNLRFPPPEQP